MTKLCLLFQTKMGQVALLTFACLSLYIGVRAIPVQPCEFLHYGDYLNAEGVIEACGDEETFFFDLEQLVYPLAVELTPLNEPQVNEPCSFSLSLKTQSGVPITEQDIVISHTERIHLLAIDTSLGDYQHIHPQPTGEPGVWQFDITPLNTGTYTLYLDFISLHGVKRTLLDTAFTVPGEPTSSRLPQGLTSEVNGYHFEMTYEQPSSHLQEPGRLTLSMLSAPSEKLPPLEPIMGAFAHLVAFDPTRKGFAHLHPLTPLLPGQETSEPQISFAFTPQQAGDYRIWAQVKVEGQELFLPFDLKIHASS